MKAFLKSLRHAVASTVILAIVCCGLYPLAVWGIAQLAFPFQANGSLIVAPDGMIRGSELLGQNFTGPKYFHSRPSAAGSGYDAANSGGSNLGPTSQKLSDTLKDRIQNYCAENGLQESAPVPADAVTASGSGLDPHISLKNAGLQIPRVAKARRLGENRIRALVRRFSQGPDLDFLGEPGVNVLRLNLALDAL